MRRVKKLGIERERNVRLSHWWQVTGLLKTGEAGKADGSHKDPRIAAANAAKTAERLFGPDPRIVVKPRYYWEVTRTYEDGRVFRASGSAFDLEKAVSGRNRALKDCDNGKVGKEHTVRAWGNHCLDRIMPEELAFRTVHGYRQILENHVYPSIGNMRLDAVTSDRIHDILDDLLRSGARPQTRRNVRYCISKVYSLAQAHRRVPIGYNPADPKLVKIKKEVERDANGHEISHKRTFTPKEYGDLLDKADGSVHGAILLGLYCGLRIGEVCGLRWVNVDLDQGIIHVREQLQFQKGKGLVPKKPKTAAGVRSIPVPRKVLEWLRGAKLLARGENVVTNCFDKPLCPSLVSKYFRRAAQDAGLFGIKDVRGVPLANPSFHDLRHTFCYYMANGWALPDGGRTPGLEITKLARIAGHASTQTTTGYYIATTDQDMVEAMMRVC